MPPVSVDCRIVGVNIKVVTDVPRYCYRGQVILQGALKMAMYLLPSTAENKPRDNVKGHKRSF